MSQAILSQIFDQLKLLDIFELQQLDHTIEKYLADKLLDAQQNEHQKFTNKKHLFKQWDDISDEEATELKAEFYAEDLDFAEIALHGYLPQLQQQDKI